MIRIYSDLLTATEVSTVLTERNVPVTIVKAEDEQPPHQELRGTEYEIHFFGKLSEEASSIVPGTRFTFRGSMVNQKIVARAFTLVP